LHGISPEPKERTKEEIVTAFTEICDDKEGLPETPEEKKKCDGFVSKYKDLLIEGLMTADSSYRSREETKFVSMSGFASRGK
jgi:hypothetical protein